MDEGEPTPGLTDHEHVPDDSRVEVIGFMIDSIFILILNFRTILIPDFIKVFF